MKQHPIIYLTIVFGISLALTSCNQMTATGNHIVSKWKSKEILFPTNSIFTIEGKDSIDYSFSITDYKIVSYVDSVGCLSCKLEFARWEGLMQEIIQDPAKPNVLLLLYIHPKNRKEVENLLFFKSFTHPICIDEQNEFDKLNQVPKEEQYHTFLLDKHNKVIGIGNPVYNIKIKELYLKLIQ